MNKTGLQPVYKHTTQTFRNLVFRSSAIQMPGSYYLPDKKLVDKLSAIQITIGITDYNILSFNVNEQLKMVIQ